MLKGGTISSSWRTALHTSLATCWAKKSNFVLLAAAVYVAPNTCAFRGGFQCKPERSAVAFDHSFLFPPKSNQKIPAISVTIDIAQSF